MSPPERAARRSEMIVREHLYIDGRWADPSSAAATEVVDSTTEAVFGRVPAGTADDVNEAVLAAGRAFDPWAALEPSARAELLVRVADGIESRMDELVRIIAGETGTTAAVCRFMQVGSPVRRFRQAAALAREYRYEQALGTSIVRREPIGVVGCITPWNFPLMQASAKVAFAMAAGCTVVLKPSELAPLDAFVLADVMHEVGMPRGVFNLVTGEGPVAGEALAGHPGVDMVSFTGSTRTGRKVAALATDHVAKVALELGGKSPNVILPGLDDATFERAVTEGIGKAFFNSGQTCSALTRMLVHQDQVERAVEIATRTAASLSVGDPLADGVDLGPMASAGQRDRVLGYIATGIEEGATLACGGLGPVPGLDRGYFVRPTVFHGVSPKMTIAQEEIFGPVLSILAYSDEDDAVRIANDVSYGLAAGVWAADLDRALAVGRRLRAGVLQINGGPNNPDAPFGGYKQSGIGREYGVHGFEEFLELKSMQLPAAG